jgi:hypothetical protein
MLTSILQEKLTYAKNLVDHWSLPILTNIIRGDYPAEFSTFTARRIGVYERAALIVLEARAGNYPESVDYWSKEALEKRILILRKAADQERSEIAEIVTPKGNQITSWDDQQRDNKRRRAIAQSSQVDGDKLDDRWG